MKTMILLAAAFGTLATGALAADRPKAPTTSSGCPQSLLLPAIQKIRESAATPAAGHVKVFDGRDSTEFANDGASGSHIKKAQMHIRKAGAERDDIAEWASETEAARMQSQNNLKQIGLATTCR